MGQFFQHLKRIGGLCHRIGKAAFGDDGGKGAAGNERVFRLPCQSPKRRCGFLAKASGNGSDGTAGDIANGLQARTLEGGFALRLQPERRHRQAADRQSLIRSRHPLEPRQRQGCIRRPGKGMTQAHAKPRHPHLDVPGKACLATQKMRAARNVEHQPVGRIQGHGGRIAYAPQLQPFEPLLIGAGVMFRHLQVRHARARIAQHQPGGEPQRQGRLVHRHQTHRAPHLFGKSERGVRPCGGAAANPQPVRREEGEP
ncbi:hypothetical protein [Rhizorhapis sp.]|uniref:hypothetical protein n=1 Tax=Rhizorhapis sp. TaxID=1968842 RepID=UPI002B469C41|nr:hypothetical protein [Rhizorhapis sp.]HKR17412.1 hypothetical protein [Rhizorhapis sp.]